MGEEKMLAVRLSPELINSIRNYAASEGKLIKIFVAELILRGLEHRSLSVRAKGKERDTANKKTVRAEFERAKQKGEVIGWAEKKMLAVRLSSELVEAVRTRATVEQRNINIILEEFIRLEIARKKGEKIELITLADIPHVPFRKRRG